MARPLRLEFAGALYHVTSRGNERRPVFADDADRTLFLDLLGRCVRRFGWSVTAYVLMTNHIHLVIQTPEPNLSRDHRRAHRIEHDVAQDFGKVGLLLDQERVEAALEEMAAAVVAAVEC